MFLTLTFRNSVVQLVLLSPPQPNIPGLPNPKEAILLHPQPGVQQPNLHPQHAGPHPHLFDSPIVRLHVLWPRHGL